MAIDLRWRSVSFYNDISLFPIVGSINILYVDRAAMLIYIWNGSSYEATEGGSGGSSITVVANYAALPDPTTVTASFYWCSASQGTAWLPGSLGGSYYNSGLYYSNGTTWEYMSSPYQATQVEVDAGVISDKFVTPSTFYNSSKWGTKQNAITLTTLGSGAATFIADTLNIPIASGGAPAGITGQIQFNNSGAFGADSGLFWDNTNKRLTLRAAGATASDIPFVVRNSADTYNILACYGSELTIIGRNLSTEPRLIIDRAGSTKMILGGTTNLNIQFPNSGFGQLNSGTQGWDIISSSGDIRTRNSSTSTILKGNFFGVGIANPAARLDVQAQGALSTDIAFRVRNSADTLNSVEYNGDGSKYWRAHSGDMHFAFDPANNRIHLKRTGTYLIQTDNAVTALQLHCNAGNASLIGGGNRFDIINGGNFHFEETSGVLATSGAGCIVMKNRTAPSTNVQDRFYLYSADITAGNAAPHFRTENGSVVKLYQNAAVTTPQGISDALTNLGVLASSTIATSIPTHDGATYDTNAIQTVTAAEYALLTPNAQTIYFIV